MTHLNRVFSSVFRLHPKFRRPLKGTPAAPTANTAEKYRETLCVRKRAHLVPKYAVQDVQCSTDTLVEEVIEEVESESEDRVSKDHIEHDVYSPGSSPYEVLEKVEEVEESEDGAPYDERDEDEDKGESAPQVFPYDLAQKTRYEMMTHRIYVAATENDSEIAALRTRHREAFTHIVRVAFSPLSGSENIMPSSWSAKETPSNDGPTELRLTCPALALHYGDKFTALSQNQLLAARNYIARVLPDRNDEWEECGFEVPFPPEACEDSRVLIVGPSDRPADVIAVLVCYLAFLAGARAGRLLARLQRLFPADSHWRGDILNNGCLDFITEVSKREWKC